MLIGKDLGLPNLVVLVVMFVIFPVIGFVVRSKWRQAVERAEEVKRLVILASEEAARAEIEANEGYFYTINSSPSFSQSDSGWIPAAKSGWVPAPVVDPAPAATVLKPSTYQCAVCLSPTSTRCAQCKAVRYCSGRCQIVHWRQGHKDECRPYVPVKPVKDVSGNSSTQGDVKDSSNTLSDENFHDSLGPKVNLEAQSHPHQPETLSVSKSSSESSFEVSSTFSTPSTSSTETNSSEDSDRMDSYQSADVKLGHQTVVSPARKFRSSGKITQNKSLSNSEDIQPRFSRSSSRADDGSNGSSLFEPSSSASDFWSGSVHSKKAASDELDEFKPSRSSRNNSNHLADSFKVTKSDHNSSVMKGVNVASTILDNTASNEMGSKTSKDEISSANNIIINALKSTRPPKYTSDVLKHNDMRITKETKMSSSVAGDHSEIKDSLSPEKSNHAVNKDITSHASKSTTVGSSSSRAVETYITSSTNRLASQSTKPVIVSESAKTGLKTSMLKVVDQLKPSKMTRQCSPRAESETAHKYSCKGLFSYEMFVKLYNWKHVELRPFGLVNCGNSCYANAVLQCLTYTPPLNAYLLQGLHSKACDKRDWCFTCEFEGLVLKAKSGNSPLSPIRILSQIESIGSGIGHGRQEDAHEFLRYAIDTLQSVCLKEAGTKASNSLEEETTLIGQTFGGYLRSKIMCMKCGNKSERHERMMDLTVEIQGDIATLEDALDKFTSTEVLDGENKYKCSRCKSYEKAKKKLTLLEAPNVLTIALKRFQSGKYGKLNKSIQFPEILNMAPYVSGTSDKSPVYRLYGVVVHIDIMNAAFSGHYVCYVKNFENRWFKMDDIRVKEVDVQSVLTKGAYMLLYARCSPRAPRLIRSLLSNHQHDSRKHKVAPSFTPRSRSTGSWNMNPDHLAIRHRTLEEESSSSSDSSGIFSESCSCSTESSNRDSNSIEDHNISWDWEHEYNNSSNSQWRNVNMTSSDSDSSSSSSFPSPLYTSRLNVYHEDDEHRKLSFSSNSYREPNFDRLGGRPVNLSESSKPTLRRSTTRGR
ncbi:ubiquitin carboxyl-terminal hydrolase 17-like [Rutidosis leptorrhynchoides]|uniref:ubiquitin carboxyl-terminal hydrolase 17-like n=1 Tax=Rutidosis leptorrhynchoides TaxID=125765 RepID=UPI003A993DB1